MDSLPTQAEREEWKKRHIPCGDTTSESRLLTLADDLESLLADSRQCTAQAMKRIADMETRIARAKGVGHSPGCECFTDDKHGDCNCPMREVIKVLEGNTP